VRGLGFSRYCTERSLHSVGKLHLYNCILIGRLSHERAFTRAFNGDACSDVINSDLVVEVLMSTLMY